MKGVSRWFTKASLEIKQVAMLLLEYFRKKIKHSTMKI